MPTYDIRVSSDSVDVKCQDSFGSFRRSRFLYGGLLLAISGLIAYGVLFAPRRGQIGLWTKLVESPAGSVPIDMDLIFVVFFLSFALFFFAVGIRYFLPFGELLRCNRDTLTWSKLPWVGFGDHWVTRTIPLAEVVGASYSIVYRSKAVYGIVLETYDQNWKLFWGIEAPEASRILGGLKALGVNMHHDPEMRYVIRKTLRDRRARL